MSTTANRPHRNQEPEPVRPWFARLFRRPTPVMTPRTTEGEHILRLTQDLTAALADAARWKRHADSYAEDRERAVEALAERIRERDGAYQERAQLLAWLTALHPATSVITQSPDVDQDGWQLLYVVAGGWQMSWHIHPRDADLFRHVTVVDVTDVRAQWDGHGTEQKYERIRNHVRLLALDELGADGTLTGVMTPPRTRRVPEGQAISFSDEVVAYRNSSRPGVLLCREHGDGWAWLTPLTSEDLPDGGTCTHGDPADLNDVCGKDVLISQEPRSA